MELNMDLVVPWLFLLIQIATLYYLGQVFKKQFWTKEAASKSTYVWWMRKTLFAHPIVVGILWSIIPGMPLAEVFPETWQGGVMHGVCAGVLSAFTHNGLKTWAKYKGIRSPKSSYAYVSMPPKPDEDPEDSEDSEA